MKIISDLIIGAIIALLASVVGYCVNHFLKLREQKMIREFEIRERGREFFHQIYGFVAILSDLAVSILRENSSDEAVILSEDGYTMQHKAEIVKRYRKAYKEYAKFWYKARKKGLEVFLPKNFARSLADFWAYAGYLYEKDHWDEDRERLIDFEGVSNKIIESLDKMLGFSKKKL